MESLQKLSPPKSDPTRAYKVITPITPIASKLDSNIELNPISPHESQVNKDNLNHSPKQPQTYYLYARYNKPFTDLHKCFAYTKGTSRLQPISPEKNKTSSIRLIEKVESDSSPESNNNPLSYLKAKIDFTPPPLWGAKQSNNASIVNLGEERSTPQSPVGRIDLTKSELSPESRRYRSVGKRLNGYPNSVSAQRNLSWKRSGTVSTNVTSHVSFDTLAERNKQARLGLKTQVQEPRRVVINNGVSRNVIEDFDEKNQLFMKNMKVLESLATEVSVGHEFISNCVQQMEKKRKENMSVIEISEDEIKKNEDFRDLMFHELGEILNNKIKSRKLEEKLKKSDIESYGEMMSMYLKKIAEGLVNQGCPESAMMLMTINKIMALELEDVFTSYVIQLELAKKNRDLLEKDTLAELAQEKAKNKQLGVMMKFRHAVHQDKLRDMQTKYERYLMESQDLRQQVKAKDAYIEELLKHIRRGLTKPIPIRSKMKRKKNIIGKKKRRYSDNLDMLSSNGSGNDD